VHDVAWNPNGQEFIMLSGFMPASCVIFDKQCQQKFAFDPIYANTIRWSPVSRFLLLGGFGNLSGNIQIWDSTSMEKVGECRSLSAITCNWAPDGRKFYTAIINPRLRVDNHYRIFKYDGELINVLDMKQTELYEVQWRPGKFSDRPPSPKKQPTATEAGQDGNAAPKKPKRIMKLREDVDFVKNAGVNNVAAPAQATEEKKTTNLPPGLKAQPAERPEKEV
jgi:translation initiation factor 2A